MARWNVEIFSQTNAYFVDIDIKTNKTKIGETLDKVYSVPRRLLKMLLLL